MNFLLESAKNEWFVWLADDDYFHKDALKILLSGFEFEKIGMVFGDWYEIDEFGDIIERKKRHNFKKDVTFGKIKLGSKNNSTGSYPGFL